MTKKRRAEFKRKTRETDIRLTLDLDGQGKLRGGTGVGFFDHMLELFAKHSGFDLTARCRGDLEVDDHHTVEDFGICLGQALRQALGDKKGIARYGSAHVPMDEALCRCVVDLSGRAFLVYQVPLKRRKIGTFDTELAEEFWKALSTSAAMNLHLELLYGKNAHHILESTFKAAARALAAAVAFDERRNGIPSTKGTL
ncbi:MAG: imidazoleglycerol-phosphate dehydratase HisB [Acidobacteriota bacterium]